MFKKKKSPYGEYPCVDYLNNALRALLKIESEDPLVDTAIAEICLCIDVEKGRYHDDVARKLAETGKCPY